MNDDYDNDKNDEHIKLVIKEQIEQIDEIEEDDDEDIETMDAKALHPTKLRAKTDTENIYKPNISIEAQNTNKLFNRKLPKKYNKKIKYLIIIYE